MSSKQQAPQSPDCCALCQSKAPLRESHIIPSFVFEWFKETSGTGFMRSNDVPNLRVQDGFKVHLLCEACEQRFQKCETQFSEEVFKPLHENRANSFSYDSWLLKFAVSVSWRALVYLRLKGLDSKLPPTLLPAVQSALDTWKEFLLDRRPNPDRFEQHMLLLKPIVNPFDRSAPSNTHRYILRSIELDAPHAQSLLYVYVKMCRVFLLGFIEMPGAKKWKGTKLHVKQGTLGGERCVVSSGFLEFVKARAQNMVRLEQALSPRQRQRIADTYQRNLERAFRSETMRALDLDALYFGDEAFQERSGEKQ